MPTHVAPLLGACLRNALRACKGNGSTRSRAGAAIVDRLVHHAEAIVLNDAYPPESSIAVFHTGQHMGSVL